MRNSDWMKVHIGDRVREHEGRHFGHVEAVANGCAKVRWEDNGWVSWMPIDDVRRSKIWLPGYGHVEEDLL